MINTNYIPGKSGPQPVTRGNDLNPYERGLDNPAGLHRAPFQQLFEKPRKTPPEPCAESHSLEMAKAAAAYYNPGIDMKENVSSTVTARPSIKELLLPLFVQVGTSDFLRADSLGFWRAGEERYWLPRFIFQRTQMVKPRIKIGIFAGLHGDEEGGILGLIDFVRHLDENPMLGREYQLWIYPICNPAGYVGCTRHSRCGKDLNREFWRNSTEPEVALLEQEIERQKFDGIISLHADDTSHGVYGFVRGATLTEHLLVPALAAAEAALPINMESSIDGFHAVNGIIHTAYDGILSAPPGAHPAPFEIILETPHLSPMELQRKAFTLALESILTTYREMISFAANI